MRRQRNAKIVATLGPASSTPAMISALFHRGVDVFRLNFSHGTPADHRKRMEAIRAVEAKAGRPIGVLMDLQGPKLRVGTFARGPVLLEEGKTLRLDLDPAAGNAKRVCLPHPEIFAILKPGLQLLLDDGKLRLEVEHSGEGYATARVMVGGKLSERKGVNIPDAIIPLSPLTAKDRRDLEYGLDLGADWVALSFVQRPEDIDEARALIGDRAWIMAKLEKPMAITKLDAIVGKADSIMVARGDLGVEMRPEQVPTVQRRILRACRRAGKPVIVATQMLESMITSPVPTRAEASDVATAVYDGADAVMLSAESAIGQFPLEAIQMVDRIAIEVEADPSYDVDGWDSAVKLCAVANVLLDEDLRPSDVEREGVGAVDKAEIRSASAAGHPYRLVGDVRHDDAGVLRARVGPVRCERGDALAVRGTTLVTHVEADMFPGGLTITSHHPDTTTTAYGMFADFLGLSR
jgi:pyruvate kinase